MWLGTEQDIGKLLKKVEKFSLPAYGQDVKKEIVQETMIRVIIQTRNHDKEKYGELNWTGVLSLSYRCFTHSVTDYARKAKNYRSATQDDTFSENEKWPAVQYLYSQPEELGVNTEGKGEICSFYLCSYKPEAVNSPKNIHAYNIIKEVVDKQIQGIVDEQVSEFIRLSVWRCNDGFSLSELANQAGFIGCPVLERAMFVTGVQFILEHGYTNIGREHNYEDLSFLLISPKSIQIKRDSIDTSDDDSDGSTTHFTILSETRPNTERSAYILEVYTLLKAAFDEEHKKIKNANKANYIYLSFWSLNMSLSEYQLALDCGFETTNAPQELKRFTAKVAQRIKKQNVDLFIDTFENEAEVLSNKEFSRTEVEQLFSHELESQVNNNE
jgi:hypothetical protein